VSDLTGVSDQDLVRESNRRYRLKEEERQREQHARYMQALADEEARDREFAASIGITYEQLEEAENYVRQKVDEER
jgi:hypothetical protein